MQPITYSLWRYRLWLLNLQDYRTYEAIDEAVVRGELQPGWLPSGEVTIEVDDREKKSVYG